VASATTKGGITHLGVASNVTDWAVELNKQGYVVFMSSRLHPDGTGDVTPLRGVIRGGGEHTLQVSVNTRRIDGV